MAARDGDAVSHVAVLTLPNAATLGGVTAAMEAMVHLRAIASTFPSRQKKNGRAPEGGSAIEKSFQACHPRPPVRFLSKPNSVRRGAGVRTAGVFHAQEIGVSISILRKSFQ